MARWGRKWGLLQLLNRNRKLSWPGLPLRRVKTVSWSNRGSASENPGRRSGKSWGSSKRSGASVSRPKSWGSGKLTSVSISWPKSWVRGSRPSPSASRPRSWGVSKPLFGKGSSHSGFVAKSQSGRAASRPAAYDAFQPGQSQSSGGGSWGSRPKSPRRKLKIWAAIIVLTLLIGGIQSFLYVDKHLREPLTKVAQLRIKQVATQAINKATTEQVASQSEFEKLVDWKMNSNGKVSGFMLNYNEHTKIRAQTITTVQSTLEHLKEIPEHIPIGNALGSPLIASYGPRVPVKFEPVGAVKVDLSTRQQNAGINMILIEVYIHIVAEVAIIIPFETEPQMVETEIPISYLLVVGDVPMYYYDNKGNPVGSSAPGAPNIALPLSKGTGVTQPSDGSMLEEQLDAPALPAPSAENESEH
ncbi:sporulation protein YunB [Paenibacillus algorifonticola]|uniref:Sporulation protein YunB n=1 Tax=Paenibacillus algorifonticola TaxID=684063 RepID=A0A1I2GK09_9BACL|nr:sporulation protein YunB [Paenibacillus algorifonticola]SFF17300.1 sporulation protein YunB [Paenibacillus algorifonticola]